MKHEDLEAIKLRYNYEFTEMENSYILFLNEEPLHEYKKEKYSRQEAESEASDTVNLTIKRFGIKNVFYDGALETIKI